MVEQTEDKERLEVAQIIYEQTDSCWIIYKTPFEKTTNDIKKKYLDIAATLSRRDSLMKKRGAVEELKAMLNRQHTYLKADRKYIWNRVEELEREIKALEAKGFGAPMASGPSNAMEARK